MGGVPRTVKIGVGIGVGNGVGVGGIGVGVGVGADRAVTIRAPTGVKVRTGIRIASSSSNVARIVAKIRRFIVIHLLLQFHLFYLCIDDAVKSAIYEYRNIDCGCGCRNYGCRGTIYMPVCIVYA